MRVTDSDAGRWDHLGQMQDAFEVKGAAWEGDGAVLGHELTVSRSE